MELRAVYIANPAHLSVRNQQLVIRQDREVSLPMEDISSLMIESRSVTITAAALQILTAYGVTVYFCDETHLPAAITLPMNQNCRQLDILRAQMAMTLPTKKRLWQAVVTTKLTNQARCLELSGREGRGELQNLASEVRSGDPDNLEAIGAAYYFPRLFGAGFTRGEECLINAALNYGYAILRGAVARNLVTRGFEPCLGIFHHSQLNQFNLADDLMEPFRPLVDLYVAKNVPDDVSPLTPALKQELFRLSNYLVQQNGKRYRAISAVGRAADSLIRILHHSGEALELPSLLPLELHHYE